MVQLTGMVCTLFRTSIERCISNDTGLTLNQWLSGSVYIGAWGFTYSMEGLKGGVGQSEQNSEIPPYMLNTLH